MQIRDDCRINFRKFGVIHKEPAFPGAADGSGLYRCFLGVRGGKARLQRHAVGTHERFGEVILLDAADRRRTHDGLGLGTQQPAGQIHPAALLRQQPGVRHAVGHIGGLEHRTRQRPHQFQRGGACINEHKILGGDECCGGCRNKLPVVQQAHAKFQKINGIFFLLRPHLGTIRFLR